jgi:hypothetical protein
VLTLLYQSRVDRLLRAKSCSLLRFTSVKSQGAKQEQQLMLIRFLFTITEKTIEIKISAAKSEKHFLVNFAKSNNISK